MEHEQKRPRFLDPVLEEIAARLFAGRETDPVRRLELGRGYLHTIGETAVQICGCALAGAALGGAKAFGGVVAFGCPLLCTVDRFLPFTAGALCIGALLRGDLLLPAVYMILLLFRLITRMWLQNEGERLRSLGAAAAMALYGMLSIITGNAGVAGMLTAIAGALAAPGVTVCFRALVRPEMRYTALWESGLFVAVYAAGCAMNGLHVASVSIAYLLGFLVSVHLARMGGSARGCVAGLLWGLGCGAEYAPAFAIAALIAGKTASTLLGVGGGAIFCMIYASFTGGYYAVRDFLPDIGIAAAIYAPAYRFGLLPHGKLSFEQPFSEDPEYTDAQSPGAAEQRLDAAASALQSLSAIFYGMSERLRDAEGYEEREDMTRVFADDYAAMSSLIRGALRKQEDDAPDRALAARIRGALAAAGFHCRSISVRGRRKKVLCARGVSRASASTDPGQLSARLSNLCGVRFLPPSFTMEGEHNITMYTRSAPVFAVGQFHAGARKRGEEVSGDCLTAFRAQDDRFYCILCDGMGSGRDAAVAARTCCVFLQKMLEGGNDPSLALEMLNSFLRAKGYECFATVDLCCIDLYTGEAYFIKGGSAPSYLLRGDHLYKIASASVPVGIIREVRAERISFSVKEGDRILMASDGVEGGDESLIESMERSKLMGEGQAVAQELLWAAERKSGARDDATVCVLTVDRSVE